MPEYILWVFFLFLPVMIFSLIAQAKVSSTFKRYSQVPSENGETASETAKKLLINNGCDDVTVQHVSGNLTDNYNPKTMTLNLSDTVYDSNSIAAIGVAAHEVGHATQKESGYPLFKLRSLIVPVVNIGSMLAFPLVIVGVILSLIASIAPSVSEFIFFLGIVAYSLSTVFALVTLPVEYNASRRAKQMLLDGQYISKDEARKVKKVLNAAALTYVAALAVSIVYLLRFIIFVASLKRND